MKPFNILRTIIATMRKFHPFAFVLLIACACSNEKKKSNDVPVSVEVKKHIEVIYQDVLPIEDFNDERISKEKFFSGIQSLYMGPKMEYSSGFKQSIGKIENYNNIDSLEINFMNFSTQKLKGVKLVWTIDDDKGTNLIWNGSLLENKSVNTWENVKLAFKLNPSLVKEKHILNIYIWNPSKEEFWIDDFDFKLFGKIALNTNITQLNSNFSFDFESNQDLLRSEKISASTARSGKMTCNLSDGSEYGIGVKKSFKDFGDQKIKKIAASVWVYPTEKNCDLVLTFSSVNKKNGELNFWHGKSTMNGVFPLNQWTILNLGIDLPTEKFNLEDDVEVGLWNKGKTGVLCDDLHIVYGDQPERISQQHYLQNKSNIELKNDKLNENVPLAQKLLRYDKKKVAGFRQYEPQDKLVAAAFYEPNLGLESILHIKKETAKMWWFNQKNKAFELVWETNDKNSILLKPNTFAAAGDFDGDKKADLLLVNKSDLTWKVYQFEAKAWVLKINGEQAFPAKWIMSINHCSTSSALLAQHKSVLVDLTDQQIEILQLVDGKWKTNNLSNGKNFVSCVNEEYLIDWNGNNFLKLNTKWRFELKEVAWSNSKMVVNYNIEFIKDEKGCNPKYYEYTALLSGNFISAKNKHLLVCYFNCANSDFNGENCKEIEENSEFPNGISFYY